MAVDGPHRAKLLNNGWVSLEMLDVEDISEPEPGKVFVLDTGSPHYITFVEDSDAVNVFSEGRAIRNSAPYAKKGINVSFVSTNGKELKIATYERGVEDETLACGTGVTAAAIAAVRRSGIANGTFHVPVKAKGGDLAVRGTLRDGRYTSLWLEGGAVRVFGGEL